MFERCAWLNEPSEWSLEDSGLDVVTDAKTDFWRETHYGFTRDTGHFFGVAVEGDFTAELRVQADYTHLYDQAGLMVRIDAENWVKTGIERSDGQALLSSVLTVGRSDWAVGALEGESRSIRLRATVAGGVLRLQSSTDGLRWPLLRLAPFPSAGTYRVGPMCCTPERSGLKVRFSEFRVGPFLPKDLHDLS